MAPPQLLWDLGSAYDLFVSLEVVHDPAGHGLRRAWAAGVRARLSGTDRDTLELARSFFPGPPFHWVYTLPEPKDSATALWTLGRLPPEKCLPTLMLSPTLPQVLGDVLQNVASRGAWDETDRQTVGATARQCGKGRLTQSVLSSMLDAWSRPGEFGERYLQALRAYHIAFFAEEEQRVRPALEAALTRAQDLAAQLSLRELLEKLSQGLRFDEPPSAAELVLAPSYWCTPIMFFSAVSAERAIWLFGAKPANASLVPGEVVPDSLLRPLKALADPTRLRILRNVAEEPLTAVELSRRLRLRIPTVTHHLRILRLATLVQLTVKEIDGQERDLYTVRAEAIEATCAALSGYLTRGGSE